MWTMIQLKFKDEEFEQEYLENLKIGLEQTGLDMEIKQIKVLGEHNERSFLDSLRLGEIIWLDKFDEILEDEGIELRDMDLYDIETQNRIETKLKQAIEEDDN